MRKLIAGPSVFICDECVDLCNDIIREEIQEAGSEGESAKLPIPAEINEILNQYVIGQQKPSACSRSLYTTTTSGCAMPHPLRTAPRMSSSVSPIFCW